MTYQISIEALGNLTPEGFAAAVQQRIETLREYDEHDAVVRAHAADADMPAAERWVTLAVPQAPAEVDAAIRRTPREDDTTEFTADYEIVGPPFETKKSRLFQRVSEAEGVAINGVVPPGKVRAFQFREIDIRKADQVRRDSEVASVTKSSRPAADQHFLDEQASREDCRNEIMRHAAQLHSDIEDLTPETIDAWEMTPFHG
jgi:hypothetical protein